MTLTTSVVICAYTEDRWSQLLAAVASVRPRTRRSTRSWWSSTTTIGCWTDPQRFPTFRSWPTRVRRAVRRPQHRHGPTSADIVFFLDDDAAAEPDLDPELLAAYREPDVLGVGGAAVPAGRARRRAWWPEEFGWVIGCSYRGQPTSTRTGPQPDGLQHVAPALGARRGRRIRHRPGPHRRPPAGVRGDRALHPGRQLFPQGRFVLEPRAVVHHAVPPARAPGPTSAPAAAPKASRRRGSPAGSGGTPPCRPSRRTSRRCFPPAWCAISRCRTWRPGRGRPSRSHRGRVGLHRRQLPPYRAVLAPRSAPPGTGRTQARLAQNR